MKRVHLLALVSIVMLAGTLAVFLQRSSRGSITVHADNVPLAQVIGEIERQGHVRIATNLDTAALLTYHVDRVSLVQALKKLGASLRAEFYIDYLFAEDDTAINNRLTDNAWDTQDNGELDWVAYFMPTGDIPVPAGREPPRGPVDEPWTPRSDIHSLHHALRHASASVGICFEAPEDYDPTVTVPKEETPIQKAAALLADSCGAAYAEVYVLRQKEQERRPEERSARNRRPGPKGPVRPPSWAKRPEPQDMATLKTAMDARMKRQFSRMRSDQRKLAEKRYETMRKLQDEIEKLPEEQRLEAMSKMMSNSDTASMILDAGGEWASKASPAERTEYYQDYQSTKKSESPD